MSVPTALEIVDEPEFDPPYDPAPGKPDSILVQCNSPTTNLFIYNAWDKQPRWFGVYGPDGETIYFGSMEWGQAVEVPNVPGVRVDYYSGDIYSYNIIPGLCRLHTETTTTTISPTTTTTATTTTSIPQDTTTTSSPPQDTTTTEPTPTTVSLPTTTTEQSTTSSTTATVLGASEPENVVLVPTVPADGSSRRLADTGPSLFDPTVLLFIALLLIAVGAVVLTPVKRLIAAHSPRTTRN